MANDPYQTPAADVTPEADGIDQTGPFSAKGRFSRLSYMAWYILLYFLSYLVMLLAGGAAMLTSGAIETGDVGALPAMTLVVIGVVGLVSLYFYVVFSVRRCHDIGSSGWYLLLMIVPIVNLVFALLLLFKPGQQANRFGPPRPTPGWEKVVGSIGYAVVALAIVGIIAAIVVPLVVGMGAPS